MCIRLSGTKYCANDKHVHVCRLNAKDMIIMVRPGLTVWWSVLNYSKWCTGITFCIYYDFFLCSNFPVLVFKIKHAFSIKWWFIVPNWTWFCYMFGFSIWMSCLHFVHHIFCEISCVNGLHHRDQYKYWYMYLYSCMYLFNLISKMTFILALIYYYIVLLSTVDSLLTVRN